jgi:hypothetical protein
MDKDLKDWTFDELVTYCTWKIMEHVIKGKLSDGVHFAMDMALRWKAEQGK